MPAHRSVLWKPAALVAGAVAYASLPDAADGQTGTDIAACLLEHTTQEHETLMKQFLLAVLSEAEQSELQRLAIRFGSGVVEIAMADCDVSMAQLDTTEFAMASEQYGELLGTRVMEAAMKRVGLTE